MDSQWLKTQLRKRYMSIRRAVPHEQRKEARRQLPYRLADHLKHVQGAVLSFAHMGSEIETDWLNQSLDTRLLLPPADPREILEVVDQIGLILVPGLAFDSFGHRLGYGKGYYDRLLSLCPTVPTIGVGFLQQFVKEALPTELHDRPVSAVFLL